MAFDSYTDDAGVLVSNKVAREWGELRPGTAVYLESGNWRLLDFVTVYDVDLYPTDGLAPHRLHSSTYSHGSKEDHTMLPVLNRKGFVLGSGGREKTIEELLPKTDMRGGYFADDTDKR